MTTEVLLAGFGGAVAVFVLGAFREWWREEREREGLLRMLLAEVEHNSVVVHTISETTRDLLSSPDLPFVQLEAWHDVRERAAALLPNELIGSLNDYYATLQTLLSLRQFSNLANERMNREIRRAAGELLGRKYPASRNPFDEYMNATLNTQDEARNRIIGYLALPWDERLLQRLFGWVDRLRCRFRHGSAEVPEP